MILPMDLGADSYDIVIERGCLKRAKKYLDLDRDVFIVTDDGVPAEYAETLAPQCKRAIITVLPQGEMTKSLDYFRLLLEKMLDFSLTRHGCAIAVGGGVAGDLTGFAAACYMRGIDFYNIPTTVLSQVDSSIGGKTAVDLNGVKNIVGAFHQPKGVLVDTGLLSTLEPRQISNGLAEAVKMAVCFDEKGFELFEAPDPLSRIDEIVMNALKIKKNVVEQDEKENGLRRALNFGHTLGHGIESASLENGLLHGESVALGMLPMASDEVRGRLLPVLRSLGLPTNCACDPDIVMRAVSHDKKSAGSGINAVLCEKVGTCVQKKLRLDELRARYMDCFFGG